MRRIRLGAAGALVAGIGLVGWATAAWAGGTLTASPSSGISPSGQTITLSGSGFTPNSTGNYLECNNDPNEPNVHLGGLVNSDVGVGCTAPAVSGNALQATGASGSFTKSYQVATGTIGPPCGAAGDLIATCPATDSAGQSPAADAAKYPCPPTAAQQAAGVTCVIHFGDQANDSAQVTILFQGESAGGPTTTAAPVATTSAPTATTAPATSADTNALAVTGPGPALWSLLGAGLGLLLVAAGLLIGARRGRLGTGASRP